MGNSKVTQDLRVLYEAGICPWCEDKLEKEKQTGSGKISDGVFCSLSCYTHYHQESIMNRAKKVQRLAQIVKSN